MARTTAYVALNIIISALCIPPFIFNVKKGNSSLVCLTFWVIIMPLINAINVHVWRNDAIDRAPVFCDISSKFELASAVGFPASLFCIIRYLAQVIQPTKSFLNHSHRRRQAMFDYTVCLGFPLFVMATHYIYQPARYGIINGVGCSYAAINVWIIYPLFMLWPVIFAVYSTIYAFHVISRLLKHRRDWKKLLSASESALTAERFIRLCLLSLTYLAIRLPTSFIYFNFLRNNFGPLVPYDWGYIHANPGEVYIVDKPASLDFNSWTPFISAVLVCIFFGFTREVSFLYAALFRYTGLSFIWHYFMSKLTPYLPSWLKPTPKPHINTSLFTASLATGSIGAIDKTSSTQNVGLEEEKLSANPSLSSLRQPHHSI